MPRDRPRRRKPNDGFLLLEALVAIAVIGTALLLPLSLLAQDVRVSARLEAQRHVRTELQAIVELLRVGVLPLEPGVLDPLSIWDTGPTSAHYRLEVAETTIPNLWEVRVEARHQVHGVDLVQSTTTLLWDPP